MAQNTRVRQAATSLVTQFPANGRIPFKQILQATWVATVALILGIGFVLGVVFSSDGKPTSGSTWYQHTPTFVSLGAVVLRGSVAALLGIALYQNLWQNVATQAPTKKDGLVETGAEGIPVKTVESLHLASRLAVGMLAHPSLKAGWVIGVLGLGVASAVQPVLQSAIAVRQQKQTVPTSLSLYHPQFNGSLAQSDSAAMYASGPTTITTRSSIAALMGENSGLRYTDANVTGVAHFGPVNYLDVICNISATPGTESNLAGWDVYNFTYRYPDSAYMNQFQNISDSLYNGVVIYTAGLSRVEVQAVLFNNTHYLAHQCMVQPAIGSCTTHLAAGIGIMGNLSCSRDRFINLDSDLNKTLSYYGPAGAVVALTGAFLNAFVGKALPDIHNRLNPGKSLFVAAALVSDTNSKFVMPSNLVSHMQRVLWVTPLLARTGTIQQAAPNVTMSVSDERNIIIYEIDKLRVLVTVAVLIIISLGCLVYVSLPCSAACGRLARDSLVHSLTVAGPYGPAIKNACLASLDNVLHAAGDEKLKFGVLIEATDLASGHVGFAEQPPLPGSHDSRPLTNVGRPVPGKWYGGQGSL
ncbi:hypothetical protein A9K55_000189 [Cordyceps militaris]|uniref:Uncharacterized protein n=1 Tax=Cordyceps militaris TaxID=73501 RepID=A0A2H4SVJ4_CORMI|nr:hypothetical protein A9K55_000189 [Cordyceps militaris]